MPIGASTMDNYIVTIEYIVVADSKEDAEKTASQTSFESSGFCKEILSAEIEADILI